jgi:23S rRNA pseudouridine1911/1915/1917 synthase
VAETKEDAGVLEPFDLADRPARVEFVVEQNYAGWTLVEYLEAKLKRPPERGRLLRLLRGKAFVHEEKEPLTPESRVWPGLKFALRRRFIGDEGEPPPIPIVHDDGALFIVDKPAGLALHPTARYFKSTLTWALAERHRNVEGFKPDPAHRLDRETSGLVACGRTSLDTRALKASFAARQVEKAYLALCEGTPSGDSFEIDQPLSVGTETVKVKVRVDPAGAQSITRCSVLARYHDATGRPLALIRCEPKTGRQHQLRVHLASIGCPLVGDKLYGADENIFLKLANSGGTPAPLGTFDVLLTEEEKRGLRLWRHALHASELSLPHPKTKEKLSFSLPLPADIAGVIAGLVQI